MLNFKEKIAPIPGWLTEKEAEFLYRTAKDLPQDANIIEIGSWKGRSTICFGKGVKDGNGAKIYAIDPHTGSSEHIKKFGSVDTYAEFLSNIKNAEVEKFIIPIQDTSASFREKYNEAVDFVFVDGAHEYEMVKMDYESWFPKLKNNHKIAFHDCWHALGVQYLTARILLFSKSVRKPKLIDTMTVFEKVERNTLTERLENWAFVLYRFLFGWIGTIKLDHFGGTVIK